MGLRATGSGFKVGVVLGLQPDGSVKVAGRFQDQEEAARRRNGRLVLVKSRIFLVSGFRSSGYFPHALAPFSQCIAFGAFLPSAWRILGNRNIAQGMGHSPPKRTSNARNETWFARTIFCVRFPLPYRCVEASADTRRVTKTRVG